VTENDHFGGSQFLSDAARARRMVDANKHDHSARLSDGLRLIQAGMGRKRAGEFNHGVHRMGGRSHEKERQCGHAKSIQ
jgi:hypothetical protein